MVIILIGKTFCTMLLSTLDEQHFIVKISVIVNFLMQGVLILTFLMKLDSREIHFIREPRHLILKKMHTILSTKTDEKLT